MCSLSHPHNLPSSALQVMLGTKRSINISQHPNYIFGFLFNKLQYLADQQKIDYKDLTFYDLTPKDQSDAMKIISALGAHGCFVTAKCVILCFFICF